MIENMSTHICSSCGHEEHTFGHGGVAAEAAKLNVPLLAELPLHLDIRLAADGGAPIVTSQPDCAAAQTFRSVARQLIADGTA
jgi:ATP-binding protein involved in chromosome partitioning